MRTSLTVGDMQKWIIKQAEKDTNSSVGKYISKEAYSKTVIKKIGQRKDFKEISIYKFSIGKCDQFRNGFQVIVDVGSLKNAKIAGWTAAVEDIKKRWGALKR